MRRVRYPCDREKKGSGSSLPRPCFSANTVRVQHMSHYHIHSTGPSARLSISTGSGRHAHPDALSRWRGCDILSSHCVMYTVTPTHPRYIPGGSHRAPMRTRNIGGSSRCAGRIGGMWLFFVGDGSAWSSCRVVMYQGLPPGQPQIRDSDKTADCVYQSLNLSSGAPNGRP